MIVTLSNLKDATAQQVFDQVVGHLRTQTTKSYSESHGKCVYRGKDEHGAVLKCAAGALIADGEYDAEEMDGANSSWNSLVHTGVVTDTHADLIGSLQSTHDSYAAQSPEQELDLQRVAEEFNLTYTPR